MKSLLSITCLLSAILLGAQSKEVETLSERVQELPLSLETAAEFHRENDQLVVITDAEFVPFSEYLGLSGVNDLPPSSAGISQQQYSLRAQHRSQQAAQQHAQQRAQHRAP